MTDLCRGECPFVVQVLDHDWLEFESLYFIDMEFCSQNLHDYIRQSSAIWVLQRPFEDNEPPINAPAKIPENKQSQLDHLDTPIRLPKAVVQPPEPNTLVHKPETQVGFDIAWEPIGPIIENIVSGLKYIHGKRVVHRDLKPQNGTVPCPAVFLNRSSPLL
jgi:hypothetical protein